MGAKRDYYELLGVERTASAEQLKQAYRRAAVMSHPDRNPDDAHAEEAFKAISEAYAVLADREKRRRYDLLGHAAFDDRAGGPAVDLGSIGEMLEGILDDVLGRRSASGSNPADLRYDLAISFVEAALGTERTIEVRRKVSCQSCDGTGAKPGSHTSDCSACRGRGQVRYQRGFFAAARDCSACDGAGVHIENPCHVCSGCGVVEVAETKKVTVPAGVSDGAVRTIRGAGEQTARGVGNLHVHVLVADHPLFTRDGADIRCEVPISFPQAALGAQIEIPTLDGKVTMRVPQGTHSGKVFRLRGKGLQIFGGYAKGDQLVTVIIEVPQKLDADQQRLLERLAEQLGSETHPQQQGFLEKLRALLE